MRTSRRGLIERGVGVAGAWWLGGVEAMAQEKAASPVTPENPANLSLCLPFLDWEPAERGTLLIVAPERATLPQPRPYYGGEPPPVAAAEPVRAGRNGFRLAAIAPRYRRKLAVVGGLSAVVPEMMAVLRYKNLPEPDLWQGVRPESRPQFLLASLSPAQWKRAMSPDGIGMSELKRDQQTLFAGLLSADIALRRQDPPAPGQTYGKTELVPTSDIDMATPRLRLYQELHWNFLFQDSKHGTLTIGDPYRAVAAPVYRFESAPRFPQFFDDDDLYGGGESPSAFGVMLVEAQPNRDKPSDVDYDAAVWNAAVPLEGTRTVGELVVRVRKATGIEIYADGRYTALSVYSRAVPGVAVRSGDLLKAIALSVTGTYRRVASGSAAALVLTDDRVGLGVRVAAIGDWLANARQQLIEARDKLIAGAKDADVSGTALWSLNDDGVPSPALLKRMAEINAKPVPSQENIAEQLVPISQLPPGVQERVRNQQQDWRAQMARSIAEEDRNDFYKPIREDGVVVRSRAKLAIVLPGIGSVALPNNDIDVEGRMTGYAVGGGESAWYASSLIPPDFKATLPVRLDTRRLEKRMLVVRVSSDADARDAALLAKARGFTGLLLPTGEQNAQTAGAWATAAKTAAPAIEIWLRTPLFRYAGIDTEPFLDRNIAGETYRA